MVQGIDVSPNDSLSDTFDVAVASPAPAAPLAAEPRSVPRHRASAKPLDDHCLLLLRHVQAQRAAGQSLAIGVTSCCVGEGVSSIAANMAICAARVDERPVLLIDAHVEKPAVARRFRLARSAGWCDLLAEAHQWQDCIRPTAVDNLSAIVAGTGRRPPVKAYHSSTVTRVITEAKRQFDLVVLDLPPAHEQGNCFALAAALDGVLLVIEAEKIRAKVAQRAREHFARADINVLGIVLNKRREHIPNWLYRRL